VLEFAARSEGKCDVRIAISAFAVVLLLMGTVWFFQGISVLPGSFMTGQIKWAIYGGIADVLGVVLLVVNRRRGTGV
jgi:hypothetical protein